MFSPTSLIDPSIPTPNLLDKNGTLQLHRSAYYDSIPHDSLRLWCYNNARYGLPTAELIDWLRKEIDGRVAIEIGSGHGDLCWHLGVPGTDNYCQEFPVTRALYDATRQPVIKYPPFVSKLWAHEAIEIFTPDVVIGCWVTQWVDDTKPVPVGGGNMYGIKEDEIINAGITYILIGNESVHATKEVMQIPHVKLELPFLRSRSKHPELNRIWIWNRQEQVNP